MFKNCIIIFQFFLLCSLLIQKPENAELLIKDLATSKELVLEGAEYIHKTFDKEFSVHSEEEYKKEIMNETKYKISIEAGLTDPWKKYVEENGICFGVDDFGKSAPEKDVFKSFYLSSDYITTQIKLMINK